MENLFGEQQVDMPDNPNLAKAANLILKAVRNSPEILDGNTIGNIDRKLRVAIWLTQGLADILSDEQIERFRLWAQDSSRCIDPELIRRARQYLVQHDHIRLSAEALRDGERQRSRLSGAFRRR